MSILKELLGLTNPDMLLEANVPIELKDVVKVFQKHHAKALSKLWGDQRLVWHRMKFFDGDEPSEAYQKAEKAAEEIIAQGYTANAQLDIGGEIDDEEFHDTVSWEVTFDSEKRECYLGYDPKRDKLYIGFDAWSDEEKFNEAFDRVFEDVTGQRFDDTNDEHKDVLEVTWEEYKSLGLGFWGLLFEISTDGVDMEAEEAMTPMTGGFYKGIYPLLKRKNPGIVDLRLE